MNNMPTPLHQGLKRIAIVVPTLNSGRYLKNLMGSIEIASRQGANVAVHFQDGGSEDDTIHHIEKWIAAMASVPTFRASMESSEDFGVAEALNKGFQHLDADVLSWIGSDDIFFPHTFNTVLSFFEHFPDHHWLTGLSTQIDVNGSPIELGKSGNLSRPAAGFSRRQLLKGRHGSRMWGFVQQEGTFWTAAAWNSAGGFIDTSLKAAFDFEIWCRMAEGHQLVQVNKPLAAFRRHSGQISSDRKLYSAEIREVRERRRLSGKELSTRLSGSENERLQAADASGRWVIRSLPPRAFLQERIVSGSSLIFRRRN